MEKMSWLPVPDRGELPEDVANLFERAEEKLGHLPNVFRAFALTPRHFMAWFRYYDLLMRDEESELSRVEREMIGVVVSAHNRCEYCLGAHGAYLRELSGDPVRSEVIIHNYRRAQLSGRERALLDFAVKLSGESYEMEESDLEALRSVGLSEQTIFEAAQVAAMFNFTNRLANALGWKPNREYYTAHRGATTDGE